MRALLSLNLDELMAKIRAEVSARGPAPSSAPPQAPAAPTRPSAASSAARERVLALLATAARYAPVSSLLPEFVGWGLLKRSVAVPLSRAVMYLSRFITNKQAIFNQAILDAVRELIELASASGASPETVEALRIQVRRLAIEVRSLQAAAPQAVAAEANAPASAPAQVAVAARLESLAVRMAAIEAQLARLSPAPASQERAPEGVTPIGRRSRSEP